MIHRLRRLIRSVLGASSPLVIARLGSVALTFGLPLILVRLLDPYEFGRYKQFFLVSQTVLLVGQLGLTQSLYYFLPRGGDERGVYVTHTLASLSLLGALAGAALYLIAPLLGGALGSSGLEAVRAPLALYAAGMLAAAPLEGALTSEGRIGGAATAYVVTDGVRALALATAAKFFGARGIFWAAAIVAGLRVGALAIVTVRRILPTARPRWASLRAQLSFALPFAGASWLYVGQRYFSQYAVSARFDAATFALFTVASFHLPVVDIVFTPITEVMMVRLGRAMGAGDRRAPLVEWDDAVLKLASILFPAACGAWLLGGEVLPLLFTRKYLAAIPLFMLATVEIPLWILPTDALLRAAGDTRFLFGFSAFRVALMGGCVLGGMRIGGLTGAIGGSLVAESISRSLMLWRGCRFLGARLPSVLDWRALGRIAGASAGALPLALAARMVLPSGALRIAVAGALYAASYLALRFVLVARPRAAPTDEPLPAPI